MTACLLSDLIDRASDLGHHTIVATIDTEQTGSVAFHAEFGFVELARLREVVLPSPHRIDPRCPYFGLCGGCKWQHMDYDEQLRLKRKQVQDALEHIGGFREIECEPCLPAPEHYGYRNKMDFSFTDLRYLTPEEIDIEPGEHDKPLDFALGFPL